MNLSDGAFPIDLGPRLPVPCSFPGIASIRPSMRTTTISVLLHLKTRTLGQRLVHLTECSSTNDVAAQRAAPGDAHGLVVVADHQTAGRGRRGRSWVSPPGKDLTFSIVLGPASPSVPLDERVGTLTLGLGLGAAEGIEAAGAGRIGLKWPNDLVAEGRKLGGILSERRGGTVIAGIGINVNAAPADAEVEHPATSLAILAGREFDRLEVLARILERIEPIWERVLAGDTDSIRRRYLERCETTGQEVRVRLGSGERLEGRAEGLDGFGCLQVRDIAGTIHSVSSGDVLSLR